MPLIDNILSQGQIWHLAFSRKSNRKMLIAIPVAEANINIICYCFSHALVSNWYISSERGMTYSISIIWLTEVPTKFTADTTSWWPAVLMRHISPGDLTRLFQFESLFQIESCRHSSPGPSVSVFFLCVPVLK